LKDYAGKVCDESRLAARFKRLAANHAHLKSFSRAIELMFDLVLLTPATVLHCGETRSRILEHTGKLSGAV